MKTIRNGEESNLITSIAPFDLSIVEDIIFQENFESLHWSVVSKLFIRYLVVNFNGDLRVKNSGESELIIIFQKLLKCT